jgi:hypothetical protein
MGQSKFLLKKQNIYAITTGSFEIGAQKNSYSCVMCVFL